MIVKIDICDDAGPAHESGPWADIRDRITTAESAPIERVAILNAGTTGGRPSVLMAIPLWGTDQYVVAEITGDMWETIAGAIRGARGRWGVGDRP